MQDEEQYSEDLREIDVADLPQEFTSKIINIIKDKQGDGNNTSVADQDDYHPSEEEEESDAYKPPVKSKNSCKKSGKKADKIPHKNAQFGGKNGHPKTLIRINRNKSGKNELQKYGVNEEVQQQISTDRRKQSTRVSNHNVESILETQQVLKEYFKDYLTAVLQKMQEITNKKLKEISNKMNYLENRLQNFGSRSKEVEMEYSAEDKQKRHPYIKSWLKLDYIQKIERGEMSTKEAARQLKLKENTILSWMGNKDKFKPESKRRKTDRDEIDSECLNIQ